MRPPHSLLRRALDRRELSFEENTGTLAVDVFMPRPSGLNMAAIILNTALKPFR